MLYYNKNLKRHAQELRKNMTDAEHLLWSKIKSQRLNGRQFYRQKTVGNYIVDFHCPKANLVIELDGGQHYSDEGREKDRARDDYLAGIGLKVLRFSDRDVFENMNGVLETIWSCLSS